MNFPRLIAIGASLWLAIASNPPESRADTISALGRVLPVGGVIEVAAPNGDTVETILVHEGDWVEAGAPLARLHSLPLARARLELAQSEAAASAEAAAADLELARQRLGLAEVEDKIADERLKRILAAKDNAIISPDKIEERQIARDDSAVRLATARDAVARAGRALATSRRSAALHIAEMTAAVAEREIRAPVRSRVLKILLNPGASTNSGSVMRLGDTSAVLVVAEIYQADALRIKPGQKATISSDALPRKFTGSVESISPMFSRNALQSLDPNAQTNGRIVEAVIRMADREPFDRLILLEVDVKIDL